MRLAWGTDVHLNFVDDEGRAAFAEAIRAGRPDAVALTGDIAEGPSLAETLEFLDGRLGLPLYFVLGNHDFYRSSIAAVRRDAAALTAASPRLRWMPAAGVISL